MTKTDREGAPATASRSEPDDRYALGVLFVHGIGQQGRGDTLVRFGEPLSDWLQRWLLGDGNGGRPPVRIGEARISPPADDAAAPAHAELEIDPGAAATGSADASAQAGSVRWLLAEAWWAQGFVTPSFRDLASWGCQVLPWTLSFHFAARARRAVQRVRETRGPRRGLAVARLVGEVIKLLLAVLLFPLLALLVLLLLVIGALPIPKVRELVGAVQRRLSSTLGDSFVLLSSPIQEAAVVGQVERDLGWLARRCVKVAVVAHSQGAAVAHRLLRRRPPDNLVRFITLGSGLGKLEEIRARWRSLERWELWQVPAGLLAVGYALPRYVSSVRADDGTQFVWIYPVMLGLLFIALGARRLLKESRPPAGELAVPAQAHWLDLYASSDPVPNGRLLDSADATREIMEPVEVHNFASAVADHTAYWRNDDQFVSRVARSLAAASGLAVDRCSGEDASRLDGAGFRRRWRVRWLAFARLAAAAFGLALVARLWGRLGVLETDVNRGLASLEGLVPLAGFLREKAAGGEAAARTVGLGAILAMSALVYGLLYALWSLWNRMETEAFFRRRAIEPFGVAFTWFFFVLAVELELTALVALGLGDGLVSAVWESVKLGLALLIAATFLAVLLVVPAAGALAKLGWIGPVGERGSYLGGIACAVAVVAALFLPRAAWMAGHQEAGAPGAWWRSLIPAPLQGDVATSNYWLLASLVAVVGGAFALHGRPAHRLVERFRRWSCAEPPTLALAHRPEARVDPDEVGRRLLERAGVLRREAASLGKRLEEHRDDEKTLAAIAERTRRSSEEAIGIAAVLGGSGDEAARSEARDLLAAFAPHSALAAVALAGGGGGSEAAIAARRFLEPHRKSGPRWQRREVEKALARLAPAAAAPPH